VVFAHLSSHPAASLAAALRRGVQTGAVSLGGCARGASWRARVRRWVSVALVSCSAPRPLQII